jgi:hypothetical protein
MSTSRCSRESGAGYETRTRIEVSTMKHALALAVVLAASTAAAQPMARPQCAVTIARAPDDVRAVIDQWVQAEPNCNVQLEIRVVPTEGGLYLLARDEHGRLRERLVPDAQSAGVLVASWVAADSSAAPQQAPAIAPMPPVAPPTPVVAPAPMGTEGALAPGAAPVVAPRVEKSRWLSLGAMAAMSGTGGGGVRGEWDVKHRGWATLGIAGSVSESGIDYYNSYDYGYGTFHMVDTKLLGYLALTNDWGKWHLRTSIGLGGVYTRAMADTSNGYQEAAGLFPTGELALSFGRDITRNWGLSAGPVVSIYGQQFNIEEMSSDYYASSTLTRELDVMMFFALRHRL